MPDQPSSFRDFGILPDDLPEPAGKVSCFFSKGRIAGQYIATGLISALGLALTALIALTMQPPLALLACVAMLMGFATFVYLGTHNDYGWVELDGNTIRAKHLYTGRMITRSVGEIESLVTILFQGRQLETAIIHKE